MSNTDFILRISDGVTALDLTPSFDTKIQKEVITSEARTKAGTLFRYKWADFDSYEFELENVSAYNAAIVNRWHKDNSSLSLSFGTALDIDAAFYFPLDETSGDLAYDLVNSYCLTFSGYNPDIVTGLFGGKARQFDVSSSNRGISTTPINGLTSGCDWWASVCFNITDVCCGTLLSLLTYNSNMDGSGFAFRVFTDSGFKFESAQESGGQVQFTIVSAIKFEHKYQAVLTNSNGTIAFWLKDHTVNTLSYLGAAPANIQWYQNSVFLTVNKFSYDAGTYHSNAVIDELRFGLHSLTQADIEFLTTARMFNPGLPIKQGVMITSDKSPFNEFAKPYTTEFNGTLELEEI